MRLRNGTRGVRMNDFLKDIIKTTGNEYASLVADGVEAGDVDNFIDTGSYVFNALLSGSINGGLPANKITALAGESATGKTFFLMGIVKNLMLNKHKKVEDLLKVDLDYNNALYEVYMYKTKAKKSINEDVMLAKLSQSQKRLYEAKDKILRKL